MFRGMTERHNEIQAIATNALEQLNIDLSINSILPGGRKPDLVMKIKTISSISRRYLIVMKISLKLVPGK